MRRLILLFSVLLVLVLAAVFNARASKPAFPQLELSPWDGRGAAIPPSHAGEDVQVSLARFGGSRRLFRFKADASRGNLLAELRDQVRAHLRGIRAGYSELTIRDGGLEVFLRNSANRDRAIERLSRTSPPSPVASNERVDVIELSNGVIRIVPSEEMFAEWQRVEMRATVERLVGLARYSAPGAQARVIGPDQVLLLMPGDPDPSRDLPMDKRAQLQVCLIEADDHGKAEGCRSAGPAPLMPGNRLILYGTSIVDAEAVIDPETGAPMVTFRLRADHAYRFIEVTAANVGRSLGFALDNQEFLRATIREATSTSRVKLTGPITAVQAQEIASYLRIGISGEYIELVEQGLVEQGIVPPSTAGTK